MDRRNFLRKTIGSGVLIATSSLPAFADDNPAIFPSRGRFERLCLAMATVHIGLEKPFSLLHISDTHLTAAYPHENDKKQKLNKERTQTFGGRQEEALRDSLAWAKLHTDYVVHTGDLIDWQSEANFDLVRKYFGENIFGTMGNHEFSPDMYYSEHKEEPTQQFRDISRPALSKVYPFDLSFHSQVVNGVNFIGIDDVYATVTSHQVEQFQEQVKLGLPIVLCMHVPFYTDDIYRATKHYWAGTDALKFTSGKITVNGAYKTQHDDPVTREFIAELRQEPLLKAILAGHEHFTTQDRFSPTAMEYVVGPNFMFHGQEILFV